ncbi:MAG: hypothetical protein KTR20_14435 [Cellvibrionaceae bacterium]|nr:hypothetical protein [Cellvibrionaceae bacterium]
MKKHTAHIHDEPDIKNLLSRMPEATAKSFSDTQLIHLKTAIGSRNWAKHAVDIRGTYHIPFTHWRYYYVILLGRNRRQLSDREKKISALLSAVIVLALIFACVTLGILFMYLLKSFVGIDIFPNFSFGIWDYFRDNILN